MEKAENSNVIPIKRPLSESKIREDRIAQDKENIFICMRELHEASVAFGKPSLLSCFLDNLCDIATAWRYENKEVCKR